jgi:multiple sugar transport system substrate-binding protein
MKKVLSILIALLMILGTQWTALAAEPEPITLTITWWGSQSRHDYTQQLLDKYTELNPHITFEASPSAWDGYWDKLSTQAAGGTMPDIIQMDYLYIATYANNNALADLTPYVESGALSTAGIDEMIVNTGKVADVLAGMPLSTTILTFGFNPDVLAEAGLEAPSFDWTWEEYVEICNTVKEKTGKYGMATHFRDINGLLYWVQQYGQKLFNEDGTALGYDDKAIFAEYCDLWKGLVDTGAMPNPDEYAQIASLDFSAQPVPMGQGAFASNWNNYTSIVAETNENIGMVTPPLKEGGELGLWLKPSMFFSVAAGSPKEAAAVDFINWFVNSQEANDIILGERGTPLSQEIRDYLAPKLNDQQQRMFAYVGQALEYCGETPPPDPQGISEIIDLTNNLVDQVMYGMITSEEAAETFYNDANAILAKNKAS